MNRQGGLLCECPGLDIRGTKTQNRTHKKRRRNETKAIQYPKIMCSFMLINLTVYVINKSF
jgi:hypothetical protein